MASIGKIELRVPFCQAGLAGYSDRAMRVVARRRGCPYAVSESLLDITMLNGGRGLAKSIDINDEDHPVGGQIVGSEPGQLAKAAQILYAHGYDVIDLNFACPVKKIKNKARGGHMLRDVGRAIEILNVVRDSLPPEAPTTVSLRRGFDDSAESAEGFYRILEAAWSVGYVAARVHGRTVEQKYVGRSRWDFLAELKVRYPERTIVGSGDVFTAEDAVRMLRETGVDAVWIARGAIGNPWVFRQASELMAGVVPSPPSIHEQREALREHFGISMEIHGEQLAGRRMRKQGIKYARFHPDGERVKAEFIGTSSLRTWQEVLEKWYSQDGPGVWPDPKSADLVNGDGESEAA